MRVLQIMGMNSTKFGGLEKCMLEMAKYLASRNDSLYIVYNSRPASQEYIDALVAANAVLLIANFVNDGFFRRVSHIVRLLRKVRPDILHMHFGKITFVSFAVAKLLGVKRTYRTMHSQPFYSDKPDLLHKLHYTLIGLFVDRIVCVSQAVERQMKSALIFCKGKTMVAYLGVFLETLEKKADESGMITIATTAFWDPVKGMDIMLDALKILIDRHKSLNIRFVQIGVGGGRGEPLKQRCHELGLDKIVEWKGICNNVPELLASCDIYVQPSRHEGIGLALMEAAVQKLPLIGSNVGGIPEMVIDGYNGYLFEKENPEELAERLYELCVNKTLRLEMGNNAWEHVRTKFSLTDNVRHMVDELYAV